MLILLKRHWAAVIGWLNLLPVTLKGIWHLVGHAGDVDFFVAHLRERGWFFDMLAWALDPPSWAYLPMVALGVLLIIWDNRRNRMTSSAHPHAHVKVDNAKMSATGHMEWPGEQPASIFISSNNQSGGITAHTVFAKQPPQKTYTRDETDVIIGPP